MGFFKRKLDFTDHWYASSELWGFVVQLILFDLGFIFIMILMIDENINYMGLSSDKSPLGRALLYTLVGMICLIMALNTLFCSFFVWMAFKTSGMVMKEYTWPPEKAEQLIEGMYDASTIEVDRSDLTKGPSWRRWPMIYPLTWIRSRGLGLTVGVCKAFKPGTTLILIGPIDEVNKQSAQNLQSIIDVTLMAHDLDYSGQREPVGDTAPSEDDASSQRAMGPTFTNAPKIRI